MALEIQKTGINSWDLMDLIKNTTSVLSETQL
jgi:hypothetical protein